MATSYYVSFIKKLKEIFMMDHAELDFGIYRIMNQKRSEIQKFLEQDLLPQVKQILAFNDTGTAALNEELEQAIQACHSLGINPDESPRVTEIKKRMAASADTAALENEVYSHLTTFFSRYYDEGDFISKRRYKDNTYAIPYNGEEVKLYWANADQYYIKTSEYFKNYTFRLPDHRAVHFVLKEASTEQNNNKAQKNQERRFALYEEEGEPTVEVINGELIIYFTYELQPKAAKQKDLNSSAVETLKALIPSDWNELLHPVSNADPRLLIEKQLTDYTAKNSFDYFIHKDLGGFLRRELDFYIKNEVMLLDDLDSAHIQAQLSTVKAVKGVGEKIIRMLASVEDFQKKLWLKKKFVVQTDYCITLDRVPQSLYAEICANEVQRKEWVRLFAIDEIKGDLTAEGYSEPLTETFLEENPFLVLDTQFFSAEFKHKLLDNIDNIDEQCNGLLINSENFQALELLQEKYVGGVKCVYIDPPYNTSASEIIYKNGYKHGCWISLIIDRLRSADSLICATGFRITAIDHAECFNLGKIEDELYGEENRLAIVSVEHNPKGRNQAKFFSENIEYLLFYAKDSIACNFRQVAISDDVLKTFTRIDDNGKYRYEPYLRARTVWSHRNRPENWYPVYVSKDLKHITSEYKEGYNVLYPITRQGEFSWKNIKSKFDALNDGDYFKAVIDNGEITLFHKYYEQEVLKNLWVDKKYQSEFNGTNLLKSMIPNSGFDYPKSVYAVQDCVKLCADREDYVLDYFAGSGTTGHAVINLNREDNGNRKFIICEMGEYFSTVTKPRIEKVIYSEDWRDGKPVSRKGISQCFKYIRLEQYEDTLNNLVLTKENNLFDSAGHVGFKESYMLGYMMDTEARGSLFNLQWFANPFAMTLKTTKDNELMETPVDMVETFNYLIGLRVETEHWHDCGNICVVEGVTHRKKEKTLVIWRNCEVIDNEALNSFFEKMDCSTLARDFDVIYVNGDNTLPNLRRDDDRWKVVLIEEEFKNRMFEEE